MRAKVFCLFLSVLFAVSLVQGPDVYARRSGGWGSRSSPSRMASPFSPRPNVPSQSNYGNTGTKSDQGGKPAGQGYGNTGTRFPGAPSSAPGSSYPQGGYGNSAQPGSGRTTPWQSQSNSTLTPLQGRMNRSFSKQESAKAYEDYKAQQSRFKTASGGGYSPSGRERSTADSIRTRAGYSPGSDYYGRRTVFYGAYGWSAPPYIYYSYPRFGIWDAMMLWFMLDHIHDAQYAAMYYNHMDDPGMQQFRAEVGRLSAENDELKSKVAALDESAKSLREQGVKPDPSYVPQDAAGVALAADADQKQVPESSEFPWAWVIGIASITWIFFRLRRRKI